jgi:hypothetical protein
MTEGRRPDGRIVTGKLVRMGADEDAFDREFWRAVPPEKRVLYLWDMVLDALAVQGNHDAGKQGLQRSVGHLRRP